MNNDLTTIKDWLAPMIITGSIIVAGIIIQRLIILYLRKQAKKENWQGAGVIITSLRGMVVLISILMGVYFGLADSPLPPSTINIAQKLHRALVILILTIITARVLAGLLKAYTSREAHAQKSLSLFNSIINIVVYVIGMLIILGAVGISITPILTALGVGGLAVALALQDTLTNLFAGVHITVARIIKAGDYVMLSSGEEGTVTDITWRVTTLLTTSNNIVIIPNSKLASTIVTNYSLPAKNMDMALPIHVGYSADLEKVEKITLEVAIEVMKELGIENAAPVVRYREFAPSAINLNLWITIHNFTDQPRIRHALMKRIYKRFKQEGIEISLPESTVRVVQSPPLS